MIFFSFGVLKNIAAKISKINIDLILAFFKITTYTQINTAHNFYICINGDCRTHCWFTYAS